MTTPEIGLARGNRYLKKAFGNLPNYTRSLAIANEAQRKLAALAPVPEVPAELDPFTSGIVSDEWIAAQVEQTAAKTRLEQSRGILLDLQRDAAASANTIFLASADAMLSDLHHELTGLLDEVGELVGELGGAATAQEAVAADAGPAWKQLSRRADDYTLLRAAQQTLMLRAAPDFWRSASSDGGESHASDAVLANLDDLWPAWRSPGQGLQVINVGGAEHRYEPWPADPAELLLWLVNSAAAVWIPTTTQLDALWRRRRDRMNPNPTRIGPRPTALNQPLNVVRYVKTITPIEEADLA